MVEQTIEDDFEGSFDTISQINEQVADFNSDLISDINEANQASLESNIIERKKKLELVDVSWKTYRIVSILIIFVSIFLINYISNLLSEKFQDKYLSTVINIILFFFVINLGVFLFYQTYYKYITQKKGEKGKKGKRGKKGVTGENDVCNIRQKKVAGFEREKPYNKNLVIERDPDTVIDFSKLKNSRKGWYNIGSSYKKENGTEAVNIVNKIIGNKCDTCKLKKNNIIAEKTTKLKLEGATEIINNSKPIIGASVNYNKNTNKIIAVQYLYDKNKKHNPEKYTIGNFGYDTKTSNKSKNVGTIGDYKNQSTSIERGGFECPPNSAVFKVEGLYDNLGMRGVKFHCQDITTGKLIKSYDNNNRKVYGVTFGMEPEADSQDYKYDKVECNIYEKTDKEFYPSFISEVGGDYSSEDKSVQNLKFNNCSVYNK